MDQRPALLYLVHRIPYPPNKGDKVRSFNMLRHLAQRYRVFLATFVDQKEDWAHVSKLRDYCEDVFVAGIEPTRAKLTAMRGLFTGEALTLPYYRNRELGRWVAEKQRQHDIRRALVFCSAMAQYISDLPNLRRVVDFVDVDSAKWTRYAEDRSGPMRWIYKREGRRLAAFESSVADWADANVLVSPAEAELFAQVAPQARQKIYPVGNGVDAEFWALDTARPSPYAAGEKAVVFSGAMDYWPNIDGAIWFAQNVWPQIKSRHPQARFYVVGMNPSAEVKALAGEDIVVTGTVPDVRPYVQHAAAVVAPLRIARGVQNKVLEAMAMSRPVVTSKTCAQGISAEVGTELLVAENGEDFACQLDQMLSDSMQADVIGKAARVRVLSDYTWDAHLVRFEALIEARTQELC